MMRSLRGALTFAVLSAVLSAGAEAQYLVAEPHGFAVGDIFGQVVAMIGDVNGDGCADYCVSATNADPAGSSSGAVYLMSGRTNAVIYTFNGTAAGQQFGYSLDGAGDVNLDGVNDIIVGSEFESPNGTGSGAARVYSGASGVQLLVFNGVHGNDRMGNAVSGAGDVNGDGHADLIVGSNKTDVGGLDTGSAIVFSGTTGQILYTFDGLGPDDQFGEAVSDCGDLNGDGFDDVMAGSNYNDQAATNAGMMRVFSGANGQILYAKNGTSATQFLGGVLGNVGDVDGDGTNDFAAGGVGDDTNGTNSGSARIWSGATGNLIWSYLGSAAGDLFGRWIDTAGDIDGDGRADFVIGIQLADITGTNAGGMKAYSGFDGSTIGAFWGRHAGDGLGERISGGGFDVNGDGFPDVIAGSPGDDTGGTNTGSAQIVMFGGATRYGVDPLDPTQLLSATFVPGPSNDRLHGFLRATGGTAFAPAIIGAATAPGSTFAASLHVLIDATPGNVLTISTALDGLGMLMNPLDLRQPVLAGQTLHVQYFCYSPTAPGTLIASNGMRLVFCP